MVFCLWNVGYSKRQVFYLSVFCWNYYLDFLLICWKFSLGFNGFTEGKICRTFFGFNSGTLWPIVHIYNFIPKLDLRKFKHNWENIKRQITGFFGECQ